MEWHEDETNEGRMHHIQYQRSDLSVRQFTYLIQARESLTSQLHRVGSVGGRGVGEGGTGVGFRVGRGVGRTGVG